MDWIIDDSEAEKLAHLLAEETGESIDVAMKLALREKLDRLLEKKRPKASVKEMLTFGEEVKKQLKGPVEDPTTMLYDENGLPK
jgi:hypothetical protein